MFSGLGGLLVWDGTGTASCRVDDGGRGCSFVEEREDREDGFRFEDWLVLLTGARGEMAVGGNWKPGLVCVEGG